MNKPIKKYLLISVLINVVVLSITRGFIGMDISCILAIVLYFVLTYFVFKQFGKEHFIKNLAIILVGTFIVHIPGRILDFRSQLVSLPEFICEIAGVILGYMFFSFGKVGRIMTVAVTIVFSIVLYINYNKVLDSLNYSNLFYKNINKITISSVPYLDSNHIEVNSKLLNTDKFIILNIWASTCGPCIAEFPEIDSLYALSLKSENILLYTAGILRKDDKKTPFQIVHERNYNFPVYAIPSWDYVRKQYSMDGVPVTFIVKDNNILFRGSLLNAWKMMIAKIRNENKE
jgi:thiol-disulfide isomerase/thioredoxin